MSTITTGARENSRWMLWLGWLFTAIPVLLMLLSAGMKLTHNAQAVDQFTNLFGWNEGKLTALGILELSCLALYVIPQTAVLGAILVTGYLGGAVATHVRVNDPSFVLVVGLGVLVWAGVFLRDARIRQLIPLRRS
jgi:hypothetical protein